MTNDSHSQIPSRFAPWIKRFDAEDATESGAAAAAGAIVVFPHAGGSAAGYRELAMALAAGGETFVVQYPQRAERINGCCARKRY